MDEFFARNRLSAYIDGELTEAETTEVARAIEENAKLRAEYLDMLRAVEFLRRHGPVEAPRRFHMSVMKAVEALPAPPRRRSLFQIPFLRLSWEGLTIAAVAVTVLVLALVAPHPKLVRTSPTSLAPEQAGKIVDVKLLPEQPVSTAPAENQAKRSDASFETEDEPAPNAQVPPHEGISKKRVSTKNEVPREPYVPEWEREPDAMAVTSPTLASGTGSDADKNTPKAYILYPNYPNVLRGIADIAHRLGGSALMAGGSALVPYDLTVENNHARVILQVPADQIGAVEEQLKTLGGLVKAEAPTDTLHRGMGGGNAVPVYVEVLYEP